MTYRSPVMIIIDIAVKDAREMPLVQYDHVVETFPVNAADEPLHIRRPPRTAPLGRIRSYVYLFRVFADSLRRVIESLG